jgi:hypothetical protein
VFVLASPFNLIGKQGSAGQGSVFRQGLEFVAITLVVFARGFVPTCTAEPLPGARDEVVAAERVAVRAVSASGFAGACDHSGVSATDILERSDCFEMRWVYAGA